MRRVRAKSLCRGKENETCKRHLFSQGLLQKGRVRRQGTADSRSTSGARFGDGPKPRIAAIEMSQIQSPLAYAMWA
jgi:hypothetical protein